MPRLWSETVETHRRAVRERTLDTAGTLVAERGVRSVTMSEIAEGSGIGRATLYKYFPDLDAILLAWHERQVSRHLEHLTAVRDRTEPAGERLKAALEAYALMRHHHGASEIAVALHSAPHVRAAEDELAAFIEELIADSARAGLARDDVPPAELARYCVHALSAAPSLSSKAAVLRLVGVVLAGLRAPAQLPRPSGTGGRPRARGRGRSSSG